MAIDLAEEIRKQQIADSLIDDSDPDPDPLGEDEDVASDDDVTFMPTKEQILAQPVPPAPPLTPTQRFMSYLGDIQNNLPTGLSAQALLQAVQKGYPASALVSLGTLPVDVHKATGALGFTASEPRGMYNLGIRSPGERRLRRQFALSHGASGGW